jgi:hypothetical protein
LSDEVERKDLGAVVEEQDPVGLAAALDQVLDRGKASYATALEEAASRYDWERVTRPLIGFVAERGGSPRLGHGQRRRLAHQLRSTAYTALQSMFNAAGVKSLGTGLLGGGSGAYNADVPDS